MKFQIATDDASVARVLIEIVGILEQTGYYHTEHVSAIREILAMMLLTINNWEFPDSEAESLRKLCLDLNKELIVYKAPPGAI